MRTVSRHFACAVSVTPHQVSACTCHSVLGTFAGNTIPLPDNILQGVHARHALHVLERQGEAAWESKLAAAVWWQGFISNSTSCLLRLHKRYAQAPCTMCLYALCT